MLVRTSIATTGELAPRADRDSVTVSNGGTVIPVSPSAWTGPASVMTLTSTLAARASMFMRSSWICLAPFVCPCPMNQISEPGSLQRTLDRPELPVSSASMAGAMTPVPVTDQPSATFVPFLLALDAAGTVSSDSAPGTVWLIGLTACSWTPAGGSGASSTWPGPVTVVGEADCAELGAPAISATWAVPPLGAGGQARTAELTATCLGAALSWLVVAGAGLSNCATPAMTPSASTTTPAGTK
jgi:hypothetical protein